VININIGLDKVFDMILEIGSFELTFDCQQMKKYELTSLLKTKDLEEVTLKFEFS
jgi:hypothetical protein